MIQLSDHLPLAQPLTLMIDSSGHCNFRCSFCPTGDHSLLKDVGRAAGYMSLDLFCKLIGDLQHFPSYPKTILLYLEGEPLMNKNIAGMVAIAKTGCPGTRVEITTNAALLKPRLSADLIAAGLDHLRVSVEAVDAAGYRRITKTYSGLPTIVANVAHFRGERDAAGSKCTIHAKIPDTGLTDYDKAYFSATWSPIADTVNVDSLFAWSDHPETQLGQSPDTGMDGKTPRKERACCPSPFKTLSIRWNGAALVCCADWRGDTQVGDASKQSLREIWEGEPMRQLRLIHLRGERHKNRACASCDYIKGMPAESDLDADRERLTKLYE